MTEADIMRACMLELSRAGFTPFRNNVGALKDITGAVIRYGVCNPGGSDIIGWVPVTITPDMVGRKLAVFLAVECKTPTGRVSTPQATFLNVVRHSGGIGIVARDAETVVDEVLSIISSTARP